MSRKHLSISFCFAMILAVPAVPQDKVLREAARLDLGHKCAEAERIYRKALAQGPPSPALLNNLGNHYIICGQPDKAQVYYQRLIKIKPADVNANLQLARIATNRKEGSRALEYLAKVKDSAPEVQLLRAEASHWAGKKTAALSILNGVEKEARGNPRVMFLLGLTCARMGLYDRAERTLNAVLAKHPNDFDVLFNLGRAAARAKHYDRARRALEVALRLRPGDADTLFELGQVYAASQDYSHAVYLLAQARQKAPKRPDIILALARAAEDAGYYGDAANACDEYLKLKPDDDLARRDCARVYGDTDTAEHMAKGLKLLTVYIQRHPGDAIAYFYMARFTWHTNPEQALDQLSAALRLNPNLLPARYARAWLLRRMGRTAESLPDLLAAVRISPDNVRVLDQLGLTYLSLDHPSEAEKVLRRALALSPNDAQVLMHLGRALVAQDRTEEAQQFFDKSQKVRSDRPLDPRAEAGIVELATMPAAERNKRVLEWLRQAIRGHPNDPEFRLHLASFLLANGRVKEATGEFRKLLTLNADSRILAEAGADLVRAKQYGLARDFLERAVADRPEARLDLAIALFFTNGPKQALEAIEKVPDQEHAGDYLIMKARILDAMGQGKEAEKILEQGLRNSTLRPDVAQQAALLLLLHGRKADALAILNRVIKSHPDDADLLLTRAIILGLMDQNSAAEQAMKQIESRWPEWNRPYLAHGLLLEGMGSAKEAKRKLEVAFELDSHDMATRCSLARLAGSAIPGPQCSCQDNLYELLLPSCVQK